MYYAILALHLLIALLLGVVVLLQRSKGNGLSGAFGGVGAGEAMFGSRGVTTMLHKATIYLAIAFMVTSLGLVYLTANRGGSGRIAPARATAGSPVLPVGGDEVAAPDLPTTAPSTTDAVVPEEGSSEDSIVPAVEPDAQDSAEGAGSAADSTQSNGEGGR